MRGVTIQGREGGQEAAAARDSDLARACPSITKTIIMALGVEFILRSQLATSFFMHAKGNKTIDCADTDRT